MRANIKNARGTIYINREPIAAARRIELKLELRPEAIEKQFPSNISKYSSIDLGPCEITEISPEFGRRVIGEADVTARRKVKPRDVVLGIVAVVLLLILAALITNRAFAVNEPPVLIIPQSPTHAASGLLIAPVPPETSPPSGMTLPERRWPAGSWRSWAT